MNSNRINHPSGQCNRCQKEVLSIEEFLKLDAPPVDVRATLRTIVIELLYLIAIRLAIASERLANRLERGAK